MTRVYIKIGKSTLCTMMGTMACRDLADKFLCSYRTKVLGESAAKRLRKRFKTVTVIKGICPHDSKRRGFK
jgi:hypothetical protein